MLAGRRPAEYEDGRPRRVSAELPAGMRASARRLEDNEGSAQERKRRSVYIFVRRNARYPMLEVFDMPDTHESCARRNITNTAPQALTC